MTKYNIISFDIGIKNLSFCVLDYNTEDTSYTIKEWEILDLTMEGKINVKDFNMVSKSLFEHMSERFPVLEDNTIVLIENQPSMRNPIMKTIQIMIYSWFAIRSKDMNVNTVIKLFSASNKLKVKRKNMISDITKQENNKYKRNKKSAVEIAHYYLQNVIKDDEYIRIFEKHKKRDDLADCFLQAIYLCENIGCVIII